MMYENIWENLFLKYIFSKMRCSSFVIIHIIVLHSTYWCIAIQIVLYSLRKIVKVVRKFEDKRQIFTNLYYQLKVKQPRVPIVIDHFCVRIYRAVERTTLDDRGRIKSMTVIIKELVMSKSAFLCFADWR